MESDVKRETRSFYEQLQEAEAEHLAEMHKLAYGEPSEMDEVEAGESSAMPGALSDARSDTAGASAAAGTPTAARGISKEMELMKMYWKRRKNLLKGRNLAKMIFFNKEYRCAEMVRHLIKDQRLARATVRAYVKYFNFTSQPLDWALRLFLGKFWPEEDIEIQSLFMKRFVYRYLSCNGKPFSLGFTLYNLSWAIVMLNADLHGGHARRKMTCEEFIWKLNKMDGECHNPYATYYNIFYNSIKETPIHAFRVKAQL